VEGLGGTFNPVGSNERQLHVNVGFSQFHLPFKMNIDPNDDVVAPQVWAGTITVSTTEPLTKVAARLANNPIFVDRGISFNARVAGKTFAGCPSKIFGGATKDECVGVYYGDCDCGDSFGAPHRFPQCSKCGGALPPFGGADDRLEIVGMCVCRRLLIGIYPGLVLA
jgi:hypothetical protein